MRIERFLRSQSIVTPRRWNTYSAMTAHVASLLLIAAATAPLSIGLIHGVDPQGGGVGYGDLNKVVLTQKNYIQFVKFLVQSPPLPSFTFCLWMKSLNLTNPQPIFSYSLEETERLVRAWISPPGAGPDFPEAELSHGTQDPITAAPHINLRVREEPVMSVPVPDLQVSRWHHVCVHWTSGMDGSRGMWHLYFDGGLRGTGVLSEKGDPEAVLPSGADIAVGQELTDFNQGLDDGFEGELYGFNLVTGPWEGLGRSLFETNFHQCTLRGGGAPPPHIDPHSQLIVDWAKSPLRAYGGAIVAAANPSCGDF